MSVVLAAAVAALVGPVAAPPRTTLSVSPAHVALQAGSRATLHIQTGAGGPLLLRASVAGLALDLRGKPRIAARREAAPWLSVSPASVEVGRRGATLVIASHRRPSSWPGDHSALVLLTATAPPAKGVAIQLRVGVVVTMRVKGRLVHRLEVVAARVGRSSVGRRSARRARMIELTFANRGNVIESIGGPRLRITLLRRGRVIARLAARRRKVLPHTAALVLVRYGGRSRGLTTIRILVAGPAGRSVVRSFPLRL
jgi:hypothetical protein